jgi:carbon monoxide dehydrogenase subunit G
MLALALPLPLALPLALSLALPLTLPPTLALPLPPSLRTPFSVPLRLREAVMQVLKTAVLVLLALVVVVFGIGALLSKDFRVERSIEIDAAPEAVFDNVNSLRNWNAWSPWVAGDPSIQNTYSGPESGVGAKVQWTSEKSGEGTQTITLSERPTRIETALDFGDMGQPNADWTFEPAGDGVRVTWGLSGTAAGPLGGYFAKMMDGWVGTDYEDGLSRLKAVIESAPAGQ